MQQASPNRPHARYGGKPPGGRVAPVDLNQLLLDRRQPERSGAILLDEHRQQFLRQRRHLFVGDEPRHERLDMDKPSRRHKAELGRMAADGVGELRAPPNQLLAHPKQHLVGLPRRTLCRDEARPRPAHRLADRLRVGRVVLARRTYGFTCCGAISTTSCPSAASSRAQ
jgi:hypothetical protein